MSKEEYDSFPFYPDIPVCPNCARILKDKIQLVNVLLQPNYERSITGKCKACKQGYNFIHKFFIGADDNKYFGTFDPTGTITTASGILCYGNEWDKNQMITENQAKHFKLNIAAKKELEKSQEPLIVDSKYWTTIDKRG